MFNAKNTLKQLNVDQLTGPYIYKADQTMHCLRYLNGRYRAKSIHIDTTYPPKSVGRKRTIKILRAELSVSTSKKPKDGG